MILFKSEFVPLILSGRKTQTRRTWSKPRAKVGGIHQLKTGYDVEPFAHARITGVRQEPLGAISEVDARAEGYDSIEEYIDVFRAVYGEWTPDTVVWVVDFEVVD